MKYKIIIFIVFAFLLLFTAQVSFAAKVLPQSKKAPAQSSIKSTGGSIGIYPRLRGDRKALLVTFSNLQNAKSVSYILTYTTNGQQEGAGGSVKPSEGATANRELLFGTCSKNVCRYHTNISNMKLEVTAELKSGKKLIKRYKIKV